MKNTSLTLDLNTGRCQWGESAGQPFRLLVSGDICPIRNTATRMLAGESGAILADIAGMLADKDLSIVNLEAPMTERPAPILKIGPNLIVSPRSVELLRAGGWDIACCANNHIGDHGPAAAMQTLELLATNGIASVGAGRDLDAARKPLFITRGGRRVAVLAFAENEFGMATPTSAGANPLQPFKNISQIREASRQADLTVVLIHGGNEYLPVPAPRVIDTYRAFAEAGASAVIGGHTHCPQGFELWHGVPIIYSLGNLLFDMDTSDLPSGGYTWWTGLSVRIAFGPQGAVGLEIIPHHFRPCGEAVLHLDGAERTRFFRYYNFISEIIADPARVQRIFDAWCLTRMDKEFCFIGAPFYPADWLDTPSYKRLLAVRNIHTCEAHNEVLTNTLRILAERRELEAREGLPHPLTLMNGGIPGDES